MEEKKCSKENKINVLARANGPIIIDGNINFDNGKGEIIELKRLSLCRCAASGKMPFCDGSHNRVNFKS